MRLGVVGRGRAARTLVPLWLAAEGLDAELGWWWSHRDARASATLETVDVVVLAVPDSAIESAAATMAARAGARSEVWLHLSGSRPAGVARADSHTPRAVGCLHPLVALTGRDERSHLAGATAGLDGDGDAVAVANQLAESIGLVPTVLTGDKALYHAAAVSVAGHAVALMVQAVEMLTRCGFTAEAAQAALQPLMRGAVGNLASSTRPQAAITGPVARGDVATVRAHLAALTDGDPGSITVYRELAQTALAISESALEPAVVAELRELLHSSSRTESSSV